MIAYENISKAFSRLDNNTRETRAADVLAGQLTGLPLNRAESFEIPVASYTFDHGRLGWETIPPLMERASPLRSTHLRDPYGPPILFGSRNPSSTNWRLRPTPIRSTSGCNISSIRAIAMRCASPPRTTAGRSGRRRNNDQKDKDVAIGRGIAFRRHFTTFIALIAEVRVHRRTGQLDLLRYVCAHDVGMIVNPDTLRHVIDRQLVYGTSRAMVEEVRFDENMVTSVDWESYPVMHMDGLPERIDIVLIRRPEEAPSGAAEMALGLVPAAIGNAVFDATGVRLRRVPFTPANVKAAHGARLSAGMSGRTA